MPSERRALRGWVLLAAWIALIAWWALTPLTETLTVRGADGTELVGEDGRIVRVELECGAPIARDIGTPAFDIPDGATLERTPCERTQSENRTLLAINAGVIAIACAAMIVATRRSRARAPSEPGPS